MLADETIRLTKQLIVIIHVFCMKESTFKKQLLHGLEKCGINLEQLAGEGGILGVAVSGGADSVSLLYALAELCKAASVPLKVITVNHFIRPDAQTCADADFVVEQCQLLKKQGCNIEVTVHELAKGEVAALAEQKGIGIEAAARELRYQAFDTFIQKNNINFLCLAHNKNDQTETLLMRFLQGAGGAASTGIPCIRDKYIRPLLWTERSAIETYLNSKNIIWRTDSTNSDTQYLRNKIRLQLVPFLNEHFSGWETAVLNGAQKAQDDSEFLQDTAGTLFNNIAAVTSQEITLKGKDFYPLERALKIRILLLAANALGSGVRIPYVFLRDICDCADNYIDGNSKKGGGNAVKSFAGIQFVLKKNEVLIKLLPQLQNEIVFSVIIEQSGVYEFPWGQVCVPDGLDFPVLLRSWHTDDMVQTADGGNKKVSEILSSWHVKQAVRSYIPVVQALNEPEQNILAVLGSCQGYKDWIVKK